MLVLETGWMGTTARDLGRMEEVVGGRGTERGGVLGGIVFGFGCLGVGVGAGAGAAEVEVEVDFSALDSFL